MFEKTQPSPDSSSDQYDRRYVVRYGSLRSLGSFEARRGERFSRGNEVLVRSERGVDWGVVLSPMSQHAAASLRRGRSKNGRILRAVSDEDRLARAGTLTKQKQFFARAAEIIREHSLVMQPVDIELVFGGEKVVLYYLAENRVDFRELVKVMAREFETRVEMRHIGIRDESRLLADYGDCGKPVCCNTHLHETPPVSMKMAKLQKASLDPNKISGRCGRLKCCLRYEYDTYEENRRELPGIGSTVVTKNGNGKVVGQELLARRLMIIFEDGRRQITEMSDIVTVISRGTRSRSGRKSADSPKTEPQTDSRDSQG